MLKEIRLDLLINYQFCFFSPYFYFNPLQLSNFQNKLSFLLEIQLYNIQLLNSTKQIKLYFI